MLFKLIPTVAIQTIVLASYVLVFVGEDANAATRLLLDSRTVDEPSERHKLQLIADGVRLRLELHTGSYLTDAAMRTRYNLTSVEGEQLNRATQTATATASAAATAGGSASAQTTGEQVETTPPHASALQRDYVLFDGTDFLLVNHTLRTVRRMNDKSASDEPSSTQEASDSREVADSGQVLTKLHSLMGSLAQGFAKHRDTVSEYVHIGEVVHADGYVLQKYEIRRLGHVAGQMQVADWSQIKDAQALIDSIAAATQRMNGAALGSRAGMLEDIVQVARQLNGFPVVYRELKPDGQLKRETLLVEHGEYVPSEMDLIAPDSYRLQSMF